MAYSAHPVQVSGLCVYVSNLFSFLLLFASASCTRLSFVLLAVPLDAS